MGESLESSTKNVMQEQRIEKIKANIEHIGGAEGWKAVAQELSGELDDTGRDALSESFNLLQAVAASSNTEPVLMRATGKIAEVARARRILEGRLQKSSQAVEAASTALRHLYDAVGEIATPEQMEQANKTMCLMDEKELGEARARLMNQKVI